MSAIIRAVTWEFYRQNRWWVGLSLCIILGLGGMYYNDPLPIYDTEEQITHFTVFIYEMIAACFFLYASQYNKRKGRMGFPEHLFIKPVSIRLIAVIQLPLAIGLGILLYLATSLCFYWATEIRWPLALPCLYLAASILFMQAMGWTLPAEPALQILSICIGILVLCGQYYHDLHTGTHAMRVWGLVLFMGISVWLAITGAALDRRSQRLSLLILWNKLARALLVLLPWRTCTDTSPQKTLFWFHWMRKGWVIPFLSLLLMVLGYILCLIEWDSRAEFIEGYFTGIFILHVVIFPLLSALIVCQQETRNQGMPVYISCLPVKHQTMIKIYLKCTLISLALSWLIYAGGITLLYLICLVTGQSQVMHQLLSHIGEAIQAAFIGIRNTNTDNYGLFSIPGVYFLLTWASLGLTGSVILTGRRVVAGVCFALIFLLPVIPNIAQAMNAPEVVVKSLAMIEAWLGILFIIVGTSLAYIYAIRKRYIPPSLSIGACLLLIAWVFFTRYLICQGITDSNPIEGLIFSLHVIAVGLLPIAPLAIAPLALAWNRHR